MRGTGQQLEAEVPPQSQLCTGGVSSHRSSRGAPRVWYKVMTQPGTAAVIHIFYKHKRMSCLVAFLLLQHENGIKQYLVLNGEQKWKFEDMCTYIYTDIYIHTCMSVFCTQKLKIHTHTPKLLLKVIKDIQNSPYWLDKATVQSGEYFKINTWYLSFKSNSERIQLFNSEEAAASTGTRSLPQTQQLLRLLSKEAGPCLQV